MVLDLIDPGVGQDAMMAAPWVTGAAVFAYESVHGKPT
jgi:hypothetical protein